MVIATHKKTGRQIELTDEQAKQMQQHGSFSGSYTYATKDVRGAAPVEKSKDKPKK